MADTTLHVCTEGSGEHTIRVGREGSQQTLAEILRHQNLPLNTRCGGRGLCAGCRVELRQGRAIHAVSRRAIEPATAPVTLPACEYRLDGSDVVTIHVPARSLLKYAPQVVATFRLNIPAGQHPLVDDLQAGDIGIAIDIGTTTVVVLIVDLLDGQVLASASAFNQQMYLGDDVLTRINLCGGGMAVVRNLQRAVTEQTIAPLLAEARQQLADRSDARRRTRVVTVAGNTTMLHLFAGVDPSSMGVAPFKPVFLEHRVLTDVKIPGLSSDVPVHLLPGCAAYVGADLAAGVVATGMLYDDATALLVDIGTNGEIILKHKGRLYGCATAAGPAFEGAGLSFGIRAGQGAISHVRLNDAPFAIEVDVIGGSNVKPIGICGSAYVDLLAEGARSGVLGQTGRLNAGAVSGLADHVMSWQEHGQALRLARGAGGQPVVVSEVDISKLLQAKAAIAAGILTLLRRAGLQPPDVRTLYLAGGFGMHINIESAIASGLLPGFTPDQMQVVGNTSLGGAYLTLLDRSLLPDLERVRENIQIVELNLDPDFESCYIDQLLLG